MTLGGQLPSTPDSSLVLRIEQARADILAEYERRLHSDGNAIARHEASLRQALANADQIISDIVASVRAGQVRIADEYRFIAREIGVSRAADGVHPRESLEAASVFFSAALSAVAGLIEPGPQWQDTYMLVAVALEQSLTLRIRESVAGYVGFLMRRVHGAQVDERRRIARDLHDRVGNSVSVAHRQLELYELYRDDQPHRANAKFAAAQAAVRESMANLRTVASDLHDIERVRHLEEPLRAYLNTADIADVDVRLAVSGEESWAPDTLLGETLLIVREAVANALRHARASTLLIDIDITPDDLRAVVRDDGCGFDPEHGGAGVGLASMRERATLVAGSLTVASLIGHGTNVEFWAPLRVGCDD